MRNIRKKSLEYRFPFLWNRISENPLGYVLILLAIILLLAAVLIG